MSMRPTDTEGFDTTPAPASWSAWRGCEYERTDCKRGADVWVRLPARGGGSYVLAMCYEHAKSVQRAKERAGSHASIEPL